MTVLVAFAEGAAIAAKSREYDMGGIPILFAAMGFVPFAGGVTAGLSAPRRIYVASLIGWFGAAIVGAMISQMPGPDRPVEGFLVPLPYTIPFALWGALIVDRHPPRLRDFRDSSLVLAGLMSVLAIIPIADHWLPGKLAWLLVGLVVVFFLWLSRRNRTSGGARSKQARHPTDDARTADDC